MNRLVVALVLLLRFVRAVLVSGARTVAVILGAGRRPDPAFVRLRFAPMSESGAALLAGLVSLTPGTTVIDIDLPRRELLLHVLDASDAPALVAGIRREFERGLALLFPEDKG